MKFPDSIACAVSLILLLGTIPAKTQISTKPRNNAKGPMSFTQALAPWPWQFPRDHGRHGEFQTEWWYFTGNLESQDGRRWGYQLTFFRSALAPALPARESRWAFRDAYVAHFTITDIESEKFYYDQRMARGALQLAGAADDSLNVFIADWFALGGNDAMRLKAGTEFGGIDLHLSNHQPPVLHGEAGLTRKGTRPGEASYYYSLPNLHTQGVLKIGENSLQVTGWSWMDHEFFTNLEQSNLEGWDWFSLHLLDSTAIMLYQLRDAAGKISSFSGGTLIGRDGKTQKISRDDFETVATSWWTSAATGGKYPIAWKVRVADYDLLITTPVKNQELDSRASTGVIYWEGYVTATGMRNGKPVSVIGYLEMTGYVKSAKPRLMAE